MRARLEQWATKEVGNTQCHVGLHEALGIADLLCQCEVLLPQSLRCLVVRPVEIKEE
jgi:hypothetical protein